MIGSSEFPMLAFGLPPDAVAWAAMLFALLALIVPVSALPQKPMPWLVVGAGLLSVGYFYFYLGGAPRIIDATTYLLQARSFALGEVGFTSPEPSAAFRGRFLIHTDAVPSTLAGIFPPGYPALLALGVRLGHYELVGPLLAAALVFVTYRLALAVTRSKGCSHIAATLSLLCVCLRYHDAETMSHGLSALLCACAMWAQVELSRGTRRVRWTALLGLSLGLLVATRQLTGLAVAVACFVATALQGRDGSVSIKSEVKRLATIALFMAPGLTLLIIHQYTVTGEIFGSPQLRYYHYADGPDGCFGWGLSKGCHYEHADVIDKMGGQGLSPRFALLNTLHRLHWHSLDIANFEPLAALAFFFAWKSRRRPRYRPLLFCLIILPLAYSGFYFAGSYPGAGARFFVELLPLWHVILAAGLWTLRLARLGFALSLFGFAVHGAYSHSSLSLPHFGPPGALVREFPRLIQEARAAEGHSQERRPSAAPLLLLESAHLFNLSYGSNPTFSVARRTGDDRERLLRSSLAAAEVWTLSSDHTRLVPIQLPPIVASPGETLILESEFDYPPLTLSDLWVHPEHLPFACVSKGRALALEQLGERSALELETAGVPPGVYDVFLHLVTLEGECLRRPLEARILPAPVRLTETDLVDATHIDRLELVFRTP